MATINNNTTGQPKAKTTVTENGKPVSGPTLLTEELPGGGLTQEEFKHTGRNLMPVEEEEKEEEDQG